MAIVSVEPIHPRRRSQYRDSLVTHYLLWLVTCDNAADGTAAAIYAAGIPRPGDVYVDGGGEICEVTGIDVDPRQNSDRHFEVNVEFSSPTPDQTDDNPLNQPWGYSYSYSETTEPYFIDRSDPAGDSGKNNQVVVNSAGEAFEQFQQRERGELTITITRNVASHNAAALDAYSHTINPADVVIDGITYAAGTLKLSPIGAVKSRKVLKTLQVVVYYAETITLKARHQGWHDHPLDVGFNELVGDKTLNTQMLRPIVNANGLPLGKPWPLNGKGAKMPNATDTPATLDFEPYFAHTDWTPLGLTEPS